MRHEQECSLVFPDPGTEMQVGRLCSRTAASAMLWSGWSFGFRPRFNSNALLKVDARIDRFREFAILAATRLGRKLPSKFGQGFHV